MKVNWEMFPMFDIDGWTESFAAIRNQGIRAILTAFGVFWGMFILVLLLGVGRGVEEGTLTSFGNYAKNTLFLWEGQRAVPFGAAPAGKPAHGTIDDLELLRRAIPQINLTSPRARAEGTPLITSDETSAAFPVYGVFPDFAAIESLRLSSGRFVSEGDQTGSRRFAVLGQRAASSLFSSANPLKKRITILNVIFEVIGVIKSSSLGGGPSDTDESIFIPYSSLQSSFKIAAPTELIAISANGDISNIELKKKAVQILSAKRQFSPTDESALFVYDHEKEIQGLQSLFSAITILVWGVGLSTLLCGIVGVSNIMLVSVRERIREFGIRKAIGATPKSIIIMIIREAIILTAISGYLGIVAGVGTLELVRWSSISSPYFKNPGIDFRIALAALFIIVLSGVFSGLIPALRAAKIPAVEALRSVS